VSLPVLTKYEKAKILGIRAVQITKGSPLYITIDHHELSKLNVLEIAEKELTARRIPFTIRRFMPDDTFEEWALNELDD
jgi:DNA-directed RNA polymerases I, II, and III subunit RPABC2